MEKEVEVWKDVVGFESLFSVSSFGNVYSKRSGKFLKQHLHANGYFTIATKIGGRKGVCLCFKVHRLVAEAFLSNFEEKPFVNHIDGVKTNNKATNLEWCTASENTLHAISLGLIDNSKRKTKRLLSEDQISFIKENYQPYSRCFGSRALAKRFGVCKNTIVKYFKS